MPTVLRILDANANRAREALRVMEEAARFVLSDAVLSERIKRMRHALVEAMSGVDNLTAHRDTPGDVGTTITTAGECERHSVGDVAAAACKRLAEALRVLEEYGKLVPDGGLPRCIEQLRYEGYDVEQTLMRAMAPMRARQWRLCVLVTQAMCPQGDWRGVVERAVGAGTDCVQLREKSLDDGQWLERARWLVDFCRPRGAAVVINDRPDIAILADADGVHLGQTDLSCAHVRKLVGGQLTVGVSTSCIEQARRAIDDGADYCGVGPMFATTTKHKDVIVGPAYFCEFVAAFAQTPHLAIGGIGVDNVHELVDAGVRGIAVSSAVCAADDPAHAVHALLDTMATAADR